jgi:hypothetical protein
VTNGATYTVTVYVTGSGDGSTFVDLQGANYNQSQYGTGTDFRLDFTGVPDGDYTARATYVSTERRGYVTVNGGDTSVTIPMELP